MSEMSTYRAELTSRIRAATEDLAWAVRGLSDKGAAYKSTPDEWSIHEHVAHVRDLEQEVNLPLLRWVTVPEMLDPLDYNRREWHDDRYDPAEPIRDIVEDLVRMREEELAIYREMTDEVWSRYRTDTRWGPITAQWIAELMYRHTLDHLQSIMALRQDLGLMAFAPPVPAGGSGGDA